VGHPAGAFPGGSVVSLCDVATGEVILQWEGDVGVLAPDGNTLAIALNREKALVRLHVTATGQRWAEMQKLKGVDLEGTIQSLAFSPDGQSLSAVVMGGGDARVRVWAPASAPFMGEVLREVHKLPSTPLGFTPDGSGLMFAGKHEVSLCDLSGPTRKS